MHRPPAEQLRRSAALALLVVAGCALPGSDGASSRAEPPRTDCQAHVGTDRNAMLPGYLLPSGNGKTVCVPLLPSANRPPPNYEGRDYYVDEFTDARLKARWHSCKADAACFRRIDAQMQRWLPPNKERATRSTGVVDPSGRIDPEGDVDLRQIRRPAFFAKAPYRESIAQAEPRTYTVEFSAPRDTFERIALEMQDPIKLRGWYIEGAGVDDGRGGRLRALAIMANGGGGQMTAIQHPDERAYRIDAATGRTIAITFPNATTETMGQRWWRENLQALNAAGFDVLAYDRRGEGISGGFSDTHTLEQGEDVFRVLEQLESGLGLRMLTPSGQLIEGSAAGGRLLAGMKARQIPILLGGYSRGSMSAAWAMTKNFVESCSYDMPAVTCTPPKGYTNIKGAILLASFASGAGYVPAAPDLKDRNLFLGGMAAEHHIAFYPNSATLAGMVHWPAAFFGKGLWDRAESLEGTIAAYDRIRGLKEIVVARGPHSIETWDPEDQRYLQQRMIAFAQAAVTGASTVPGARPWTDLKSLVATTPDRWEPSSRPEWPPSARTP
ncbi:Alpha/beta hydrolase family protein [Variovorax sp. PBS-H4]|uniref:alpha/beta fold hydrolase n=1 Tax=Variovorax sp. PBS-H4 TaxID=434008 RepID=UPI001316384D|nr:alpha/beta fold hydrolase [Variovorax sp. PBS-H4]VTU31388.1 Alpha/beta hydrolase family protein [Variovorax sp. PBS-H4]